MFQRLSAVSTALFLISSLQASDRSELLETKCGRSTWSSLQGTLPNAGLPTEKGAVQSCLQSARHAYEVCQRAVDSAIDAKNNAGAAKKSGVKGQYNDQREALDRAAKFSAKDAAANRKCASSATTAVGACSGFTGSGPAMSFAQNMQRECSNAAGAAESNADSFNQGKSTDDQLSEGSGSSGMPQMPQMPQQQAQTSSSPSSTGYQSSASSAASTAQSSSTSINPFPSINLSDPDGTKAMNSIGADSSSSAPPAPQFAGPSETVIVPTEFKKAEAVEPGVIELNRPGTVASNNGASATPKMGSDSSTAAGAGSGAKAAGAGAETPAAGGGSYAGGGDSGLMSGLDNKESDISEGPGMAGRGSVQDVADNSGNDGAGSALSIRPRITAPGRGIVSSNDAKIGRIEPGNKRGYPENTHKRTLASATESDGPSKGKLMMIPLSGILLWAAAALLRRYRDRLA